MHKWCSKYKKIVYICSSSIIKRRCEWIVSLHCSFQQEPFIKALHSVFAKQLIYSMTAQIMTKLIWLHIGLNRLPGHGIRVYVQLRFFVIILWLFYILCVAFRWFWLYYYGYIVVILPKAPKGHTKNIK